MNGFIYFEANGEKPAPDLKGLRALGTEIFFHEESIGADDCLIAWASPSGDIHYSRKGSDVFLILSGFISEIKNGPAVQNQQQAAKLLMEMLEADSSNTALKSLLERLHGSFGIYFRDFKKGLSLCLTDRMGSRPMYRFRDGNAWVISSNANAIAYAIPSIKFDDGSLGAYLLYGCPLEPRKSLFAGVEATTHGSITRLLNNGAVEESRWYRFAHKPDERLSFSAWLDLAAERLTQTAARVAKQCEQPVVFFSGGVDSRLAAAALKAAGASPLLVTLGDSRNIEVKVSESAASALGLKHIVILRDKHWYLQNLARCSFETGGSFIWTHGHFARAIGQLREQHNATDFVLGDFSEAFSKLFCSDEMDKQRMLSPDEFVSNFDATRPKLYRAKDRQRTLSFLNPAIRAGVEDAMKRDMSKRYDDLRRATNDPRILADQFTRWDAAGTLPTFSMFLDVRSAAREKNLMFDRDIHELLEIMPARIREERNLGALLIKRFSPRAGMVVNSNSLLPICWPIKAHKFSKKVKPLLGRVRRLALGKSHRTTGAWPEKAALYGADFRWREKLDEVLNDAQLFPGEIFDHKQVLAAWGELKAGNRDVALDLEKILQLGLFNQLKRAGISRRMEESLVA